MKKIIELMNKYKELILYVVFGVLTTAVNIVAFWVCGKILGDELYLISNAIAWFAAVVFAYFTNKLFVFESRSFDLRTVIKEVGVFFAARAFSFGVEEGGMWLFIDVLNFGEFSIEILGFEIDGQMITKIIFSVIVIVLNYFTSKFIAFKKKRNEK